jgi:hypothetical protein
MVVERNEVSCKKDLGTGYQLYLTKDRYTVADKLSYRKGGKSFAY